MANFFFKTRMRIDARVRDDGPMRFEWVSLMLFGHEGGGWCGDGVPAKDERHRKCTADGGNSKRQMLSPGHFQRTRNVPSEQKSFRRNETLCFFIERLSPAFACFTINGHNTTIPRKQQTTMTK
jgi:hypothetical protein